MTIAPLGPSPYLYNDLTCNSYTMGARDLSDIHPKPEASAEVVYIRQIMSAHGISNMYHVCGYCVWVGANA